MNLANKLEIELMLLYIFNNALYEVFREIEEDSNGS